MNYYVYILFDPQTQIPFYVGKGSGLRYEDHLRDARNGSKLPVHCKIRSLLKQQFIPTVVFVETGLCEEDAFQLEIRKIKEIGRRDLKVGPLLNMTNGGDGISGRIWTEEQKKRQSAITKQLHASGHYSYDHLRDKPRDESTKQKISQTLNGQEHTAERRKNISDATRLAMAKFSNKWLVIAPETSFCVENLRNLREMGLANLYTSYRSGKPISRGPFKGYTLSLLN